ncbi:C40 family peptidase [Lysobacter terrae]
MTTRKSGRLAATTADFTARPAGIWARLALSIALCVPALAASAAPADDDAPFPTKAKQTEVAALPAAKPSFTERAFGLVADANRLLIPASSFQLPAEAIGTPVGEDSKVKSVLQKALTLLGTPYRWGGTDPSKGLDCSGLVGYVFRSALGIELPRVSRDMAKNGELVTDRAKLMAGDLVFFGLKGRVNHVGIYLGDGRFVHAPSRGKDVTVSSLDQGYWSGRFLQARRLGVDGT